MRAAFLWALTLALIPLCCPAAASQSAPLTVEELRCKGNESTSCRFILGYLYLSAGDRVNEEEIQNAQLRLSWLRIFESVDIYLEKGSRKGNAVVVVEVKEASPITKESVRKRVFPASANLSTRTSLITTSLALARFSACKCRNGFRLPARHSERMRFGYRTSIRSYSIQSATC